MSKKETKQEPIQEEEVLTEEQAPETAEAPEAEKKAEEKPADGELEAAKKKAAEQEEKYLRLAAEYDNYRKRTVREKETLYQDAKLDTIAKFLDVYDNLERAVSQEGDEDSPHKKGLEMIFRQFIDILEKMGVSIEDPTGKEFDPEKHEAVMHLDSEDYGENIVAQVFQKGFILEDRVIRFAKCQVAN